MKKPVNVLAVGVCTCEREPMGRGGLEGYNRKDTYLFQRVSMEGKQHIRMFPEEAGDYYETCGRGLFKEYFSVIKEHEVKDEPVQA